MAIGINGKNITDKLANNLDKARENRVDAMEKLSSGQVFTANDPRPSERALAEKMDFRLRSLSASKRNINDGISLLQTAESALSEINNMILRMKELNLTAAGSTVTDQERKYLLVEYEALHDEINRIAVTTDYNGMPLLNGLSDKVPEELILRIDDPFIDEDTDEEDMNVIRFDGLRSIVATTEGLGLRTAKTLLTGSDNDGVTLEDAVGMLETDEENFATIYDQALNILSTQRAVFGALQARLQKSMDYVDVYQENIAAAKSNIADTDYAREVVRMTESTILSQAATGLLAQSNLDAQLSLNLLNSLLR